MKVSMTAAALLLAGFAVQLGSTGVARAEDRNRYSASAICGTGYSVIDQHSKDGFYYTYLLYNSSNGNNCVVTLKQRDFGSRTYVQAHIRPAPGHYTSRTVDEDDYKYYAGPVYLHAPGRCVVWGGYVDVEHRRYGYNTPSDRGEHCG